MPTKKARTSKTSSSSQESSPSPTVVEALRRLGLVIVPGGRALRRDATGRIVARNTHEIEKRLEQALGKTIKLGSGYVIVSEAPQDEPPVISRPYLAPLGAKSANATKITSAVKQVAAPKALRKVK